VPNGAKGVPARFVSVRPATAAEASSEGWRLCLRPNKTLAGISKGSSDSGDFDVESESRLEGGE
jgi:hypothetical protein